MDVASLDLDRGALQADVGRERRPAHGDQYHVDLDRLLAERDHHRRLTDSGRLDRDAGADGDAPLAERSIEDLGRVGLHAGQHLVEHLEEVDLGAEVG